MSRSPDAFDESQLAECPVKAGFRLRGMGMTRTETFTDAAFAFAVTLLVVSIDAIPTNYGELIEMLKGIPAFTASFALLMMFWSGHWRWSRRFGMEDTTSVLLSIALVFVVLVYVYPLKFVTTLFMVWVSGMSVGGATLTPGQEAEQLHNIFAIYGLGFVCMTLLIAGLNGHALRRAKALRLNAVEAVTTRDEIESWLILAAVGLCSVTLAWLVPPTRYVLPGWVYCVLPIVMPLHAILRGKRVSRIEAAQQV